MNRLRLSNSNECEKPPRGWWCSRTRGHGGPCATYPQYKLSAEQIRPGLILVDVDGCFHKVIKERQGYWLLSRHDNFDMPGHLWTLGSLIARGNRPWG